MQSPIERLSQQVVELSTRMGELTRVVDTAEALEGEIRHR
jgi:hypothetical protein